MLLPSVCLQADQLSQQLAVSAQMRDEALAARERERIEHQRMAQTTSDAQEEVLEKRKEEFERLAISRKQPKANKPARNRAMEEKMNDNVQRKSYNCSCRK